MSDVLRTESIDQVDLLKLDVEGAELEVLEGIGDRDWPSIKQVVGELHLQHGGAKYLHQGARGQALQADSRAGAGHGTNAVPPLLRQT